MNFIRRFFKVVLAWILSLSLFVLASAVAVSLTLGNSSYIKTALEKSNIYKTFVGAALDLALYQNNAQNTESIDKKTITELVPIVMASITPQFLQKTTESIIDSTFNWLNGTTKKPELLIKTDDVKTRLQSQLSTYLQNRVANLPTCPKSTQAQDFDPLNATCKPAVVVRESDIDTAVANIIDSIPMLQKGEISTQTIDPNNSFSTNKIAVKIPAAFNWFKISPYVVISIIVTSGISVILLGGRKNSRTWRTVGHTFIWAGLLLVITGAVLIIFTSKLETGLLSGTTEQQIIFVKTVILPVVQIFTKSLGNYYLYFGVGYAVIGAIIYVLAHQLRLKELLAVANANSPQ